eukprot:m.334801 g.334801  ORF g.334801 m.334801 type:complete len:266 (+) comp17443_c0_seq1:65-862(+)
MDVSLDDIIDSGAKKMSTTPRGGRSRGGGGRGRGGRSTRVSANVAGKSVGRRNTKPFTRKENVVYVERVQHGFMHLSASIEDIANADAQERTLKVGKETDIKRLAGSISYVLDKCGEPPTLLASGAPSVNQAIKAICIVRSVLAKRTDGIDICARVIFDGDSPRCTIITSSTTTYANEALETDLIVKPNTDPFKVAGAIAGRIRDGNDVGIQVVGPEPVFKAIESIAIAGKYLKQDSVKLTFGPAWTVIEDEQNTTGIHFSITRA